MSVKTNKNQSFITKKLVMEKSMELVTTDCSVMVMENSMEKVTTDCSEPKERLPHTKDWVIAEE